jgi:hypothetical protein
VFAFLLTFPFLILVSVGLITSLEGVMGSGKTLTAVALAYTEFVQNNKKVLSNIHLNFPYTHITNQYLMENIVGTELDDCVTILDEAQQFMDARRSGGKLNLIWGYYTVQTRKRNVDLFACFHHLDVMDKRFRRQIDIRGTCRYRKEEPCTKCNGEGIILKGKAAQCIFCDGVGHKPQTVACLVCGGTGSMSLNHPCTECNGLGQITGASEEPCEKCHGTGLVCPRCLGWGSTGWATTKFLDLRTGTRNKVTVFGPAFFGLYSTAETIPLTGKQMRVPVEDL